MARPSGAEEDSGVTQHHSGLCHSTQAPRTAGTPLPYTYHPPFSRACLEFGSSIDTDTDLRFSSTGQTAWNRCPFWFSWMSERFIQRDLILQPVSSGVFTLSALRVQKLLPPPQTLSHPCWGDINYSSLQCIQSCPSSVRGINPLKLGHPDLHSPSFESLSIAKAAQTAKERGAYCSRHF